jgi:pimeloyl-ACP methyl ester carboxylesterase
MTDTFVDVGGVRIRYLSVGSGPQLVLLHTLRTQLDMFQKVIPALAGRFRVLALDYPGHGHSDAPDGTYDSEFFVASITEALARLDVREAVVVGESIGATIGLLLAARHNPRVRAVVAINPYDYDRGRGIRRSSWLANVVFGMAAVPVVGELVMRMGSYAVVRRILYGGVYRRGSMPDALVRDLYDSGNREGHARAIARLMRESASWEGARREYAKIGVPVLLVYGDHDWSRPEEQDADSRTIPGARLHVVQGAGHFLSLDAPEEVVRLASREAAANG